MLPNVGLASTTSSRAPERVDAAVLGARGRLIVIVSATGAVVGARPRAVVRSASAHLERAIAAVDATELLARIPVELTSARATSACKLAILVAYASDRGQMIIGATPGMHGFRFRADRLVDITRADDAPDMVAFADDAMPGDAYVFCSDALCAAVSETAMLGALRADYHPRSVATAIVELADAAGRGTDATCIVSRPIDRRRTVRAEPARVPAPLYDGDRLRTSQQRLERLLEELREMQARVLVTNPEGFSARRFIARIAEIEQALARIRLGTYGRCIRCDAVIEMPRIDARPDELRCARCSGST